MVLLGVGEGPLQDRRISKLTLQQQIDVVAFLDSRSASTYQDGRCLDSQLSGW